jgi:hypothetical protein
MLVLPGFDQVKVMRGRRFCPARGLKIKQFVTRRKYAPFSRRNSFANKIDIMSISV